MLISSLAHRQETFDFVAEKLRRQGALSFFLTPTGARIPAFRGRFGARCAIGHLIPDDLYRAEFETMSATRVCAIVEGRPLDKREQDFCIALVNLHDSSIRGSPHVGPRLEKALTTFASEFNLKLKPKEYS